MEVQLDMPDYLILQRAYEEFSSVKIDANWNAAATINYCFGGSYIITKEELKPMGITTTHQEFMLVKYVEEAVNASHVGSTFFHQSKISNKAFFYRCVLRSSALKVVQWLAEYQEYAEELKERDRANETKEKNGN